jgi:hypothetical protein
MGYIAKAIPIDAPAGFLSHGCVMPAWRQGTWYPHPSTARRAASAWLRRNPGASVVILDYLTRKEIAWIT